MLFLYVLGGKKIKILKILHDEYYLTPRSCLPSFIPFSPFPVDRIKKMTSTLSWSLINSVEKVRKHISMD